MNTISVLDLGNILCADDGLGVYAAQRMQEENCPLHMRNMDMGASIQDILPQLHDMKHVPFLNAVQHGAKPGTVLLCSAAGFTFRDASPEIVHCMNTFAQICLDLQPWTQRTNRSIPDIESEAISTWRPRLSSVIQNCLNKYMDYARNVILKLSTGQEYKEVKKNVFGCPRKNH